MGAARPGISFPAVRNREEYDALVKSDPLFRRLAALICRQHGLSGLGLTRLSVGTSICFQVGREFVLKLFAPIFERNCEAECAVLSYLPGKLPVAVPELVARGSLDDWQYLLMTYLGERPLADSWGSVSGSCKLHLFEELGRVLAVLHKHTDQCWFPLRTDWNSFLTCRAASAVSRHRRLGLDETWVQRAEEFLGSIDLRTPGWFRPSLLHTEIMREHIIVADVSSSPRISGLIDFEAAMFGHPEFEFSWAGVQLTRGDKRLLGALLDGYGLPDTARDTAFRRRLMAYTLLHPYSVMKWYFDWMPVPCGVTTFEQLAELWWAA
ncbi:aminoglycoside phosphotransferase family protein [Mesorhizobium sp.]|uniref:phosphotransferase family protein n=1 Tax=Mesorhizobium sp. TaxID=1871066 RepID=UPI0012187AF7|nr:aminoglycoside phosphotransferase family protein [Mesorhizobium sp.]TIM38352.1 MAG: aminoglycoside phosphotransferase family protein [Mesorhizobium sp.]